MGLFGFDPVKKVGGWEVAMTEEEIAEMEKEGYDMSSVRGRQTEMVAQEEADKAAFADRREAAAVPTNLNELTPYHSAPRSAESSFFRDVTGEAPLFGREKWREKYANAPMVCGAAIQANSDLWLPGTGEHLPTVFVFALDSPHVYDVGWLRDTAGKISEMRASSVVPAGCQEFIHILRDDQSEFCSLLRASLADGVDAWRVTFKFNKQAILSGNRLPEGGIVPFLLEARPKKQMPIQLTPIPGEYYRA